MKLSDYPELITILDWLDWAESEDGVPEHEEIPAPVDLWPGNEGSYDKDKAYNDRIYRR